MTFYHLKRYNKVITKEGVNLAVSLKKKPKTDPINGLGKNDDKLSVQKSRPLFALWSSEITLPEFKILDTYLARIDSHKPEQRTVIFERGELENVLGVTKLSGPLLKKRLKHLMSQVVEIPDATESNGFRLLTLFEEAEAAPDENGVWQVKMECTSKAMKYIFNMENLGYFRYKLRCITSISSRYSYIMFIYLESSRFHGLSWDVPLDDLKHILRCDTQKTYGSYKEFNKQILKRVHEELSLKTECRYSYTPIKRGRTVVAIHFDLEPLSPPLPELQSPLDLLDNEAALQSDFYRAACCPAGTEEPEFSAEEIEVLLSIIRTFPDNKLPPHEYGIDFSREAYLRQKYASMCAYATKRNIKHRFAYLKKIIEKDAESIL